MIKILCVSPLKFDGTSFYRAWGVFKDLSSKVDIEVTDYVQKMGGWSWADFINFDVILMQRPGTPEHEKVLEFCQRVGLKVWVDYDDNFFVLPPENRMAEGVDEKAKQRMVSIIQAADVVTVSTAALRDQMIALKAKYVEIIPNALHVDSFPPATKFNTKRPQIPPNPHKQVYLWRGSDTHWMDVFDYIEPLTNAMAARKDVDWVFMGWRPAYLDRFGIPYAYIKPDDIFNYWSRLKLARPELLHVMLTPNQFNLNKSNIAWIEATAAGAVCVAPAWPEWDRPGIFQYKSLEEYRDFLINANDLKPADKWQESMDYIQENLLLSKVNRQRAVILEKLMGDFKFPKMEQPIPQSMVE